MDTAGRQLARTATDEHGEYAATGLPGGYLSIAVSSVGRKAGHAVPDRVHRLLNRIEWDAAEVPDGLRDHVVEYLGDVTGMPC